MVSERSGPVRGREDSTRRAGRPHSVAPELALAIRSNALPSWPELAAHRTKCAWSRRSQPLRESGARTLATLRGRDRRERVEGTVLTSLVPLALIAAPACRSTQDGVPAPPACSLAESDRAWIERALEAWRFASREITGIGRLPRYRAIFFDAECVLTSDDALTSPDPGAVTWHAVRHAGSITVPDGTQVPSSGATSFTSGKDGTYWCVMSTPSVWEAAGVGKGSSLATIMIAVFLHEASHVAQLRPYGPRLGALIERNRLPDSFDDDAVQDRFRSDAEFAASV